MNLQTTETKKGFENYKIKLMEIKNKYLIESMEAKRFFADPKKNKKTSKDRIPK